MTRARDLAAFVSNADGDIKFDTDTLFIDSSANKVGINNNAPVEFLTVGDTSDSASKIQMLSSTSGVNTVHFGDGASAAAYRGYINYAHSTDAMSIGTSASDKVIIDGDGRMGIGTTPAAITDTTGVRSVQLGATFLSHFTPDQDGTTSISNNVYWNGSNNKALFTGTQTAYLQQDRSHRFRTGASVSAGANATLAEVVRIDNEGIKFNGDTAAANALNDYERGLHTISINQGGIGFHSLYQNFQYIKIGDFVNVHGLCLVTSSGDSNDLRINMPFTSKSSGLGQSADGTHGLVSSYNVPTGSGGIRCVISKGTSQLRFLKTVDNAVWTGLLGNELANGDHLYVNITYEVA